MHFHFKLLLRHWALVIGYCSFALGAFAQSDAPKPAQLRFVFVDETAGTYSLKIGREFKRISSSPYSISPIITPPGFGQLEIHKTLPIIDPETGENLRIKLTSFTPPANTTAALVIVTPQFPTDPTLIPTARIEFIDNDPSAFPAGSIRVLNRSLHAMGAQFGEATFRIEPSTVQIIRPVTNERGLVRSRIAGPTAGGGWKVIDDNVAVVKPNTRMTGLFLFSPSGMRFRFNEAFIAERGEPPPSHVWLTYTDTP